MDAAREYERGIVFSARAFGRPAATGLVFLMPIVDRLVKVDLRTVTLNVPAQEVNHEGQRAGEGERGTARNVVWAICEVATMKFSTWTIAAFGSTIRK